MCQSYGLVQRKRSRMCSGLGSSNTTQQRSDVLAPLHIDTNSLRLLTETTRDLTSDFGTGEPDGGSLLRHKPFLIH